MSSEARESVAFLQDLLVRKVSYDSRDPAHMRELSGACQLIEDYALIIDMIPELSRKIGGLKAREDDGLSGLEQRRQLLEELRGALGEVQEKLLVEIEAEKARAKADANSDKTSQWTWGDEKVPPFDGVVAIDLGNSNVVCSHWNFQTQDPEVATNEPVAVNVLDARGFHKLETGSYRVGVKALRQRKQFNLYQSFRRWMGTQHKPPPAITGSKLIPVAIPDLVGALIKEALETLTAQLSPGGEPMRFPNVVVTVPASGDAAFEYELRKVFDRLGVQGSAELDEATAAGTYTLLKPVLQREYMQGEEPLTPGQWYAEQYGMEFDGTRGTMDVLCVDVGGGTTDLSLLQLGIVEDSRACRISVEVVATNGFHELSGEGLTLYLYDLLKRRLALAIADPRCALAGEALRGPDAHPWFEFHELEGGADTKYISQHLLEDIEGVLEAWDEVAGRGPLSDRLKASIDMLFPTITKDAPVVGKKVRRVNFRYLWDEAERLKREISAMRANGAPLPVRGRLNVKAAKRQAKSVHLDTHIRAAGLDPTRPMLLDALAISSVDIDAFVESRGQPVLAAVKEMIEGRTVRRVLLAGNGAHDVRFALTRAFSQQLAISPQQVEFDAAQAKISVSKGACLWAIGNRLEGIHVTILRRPRHSTTLNLVSAVRNAELFKRGDVINRFSYVQPPAREGDEGAKLVQVDRVVAGKLKPFMMFRPERDGRPLPDLADQPIFQRKDLAIEYVNQFLTATRDGDRVDYTVKDPDQYIQMEIEWVSNWEMLEMLRKEMTMDEVIAWIESATELQEEPPAGCAFHRYYMDENRELHLVYHARGEKQIVLGTVTDSARKALPPELDPFSGAH